MDEEGSAGTVHVQRPHAGFAREAYRVQGLVNAAKVRFVSDVVREIRS